MKLSNKHKGSSKKRNKYIISYGINFENMEFIEYNKKDVILETFIEDGSTFIKKMFIKNIDEAIGSSDAMFDIQNPLTPSERISKYKDITSIYRFYSNGDRDIIYTKYLEINPHRLGSKNVLQEDLQYCLSYTVIEWDSDEVIEFLYWDYPHSLKVVLKSDKYKSILLSEGCWDVIIKGDNNEEDNK